MAHTSSQDYRPLYQQESDSLHDVKRAIGSVKRAASCIRCCCTTYLSLNIFGVIFQLGFISLKMILYFNEVARCKSAGYQSRICENASKLEFLALLYFLLALLGHGFGIYFGVLGIQASRKKSSHTLREFSHFFALQFSISVFTILGCLFIIRLELGVHAPVEIKDETGAWACLGVAFLIILGTICSCLYFGVKEFGARVEAYQSIISIDSSALLMANSTNLTNVDLRSNLIASFQVDGSHL